MGYSQAYELVKAYLGIVIIGALVWYILQAIACWKIFAKTGEAGWKAFIPVYNECVLFKISWGSVYGYLWLATTFVGAIIVAAVAPNTVFSYIGTVSQFVGAILVICRNFKEASVFGHGVGYGLGLTFLTPIFNLILGFGDDQYKGL